MSGNKQLTVQEQFAVRCAELLDETTKEAAQSQHALDNYLGLGAGERVVAGDHEERHLLELLQNARDAIYRGRLRSEQVTVPGRVYVAVTQHGMAMANTGDPFRLNDEEVLKAVRLLQRSEKNEPGFIGHKGVGLKSILLRAGAFAVRSRMDGEVLRAIFSRSHTANYLLEEAASLPSDQERYVQQQLPGLPLFTQPHVDTADGNSLGPDTSLVEALIKDTGERRIGLDDHGERVSLPSYTTVVYLPYQDERWQDLLDSTKEKLPSEDLETFEQAKQQSSLDPFHVNADDLWKELVSLDHRVLVLLGEIGELQFARFEGGDVQEIYRIEIREPLSPLSGCQEQRPRRVLVEQKRWVLNRDAEETVERSFVVLSTSTDLGPVDKEAHTDDKVHEPREHIRILLEIPDSDHILRSEPLFLYYPIETELTGLPFLIHGPFRVNSSRTALVRSQKGHNQKVLNQAVALLKEQVPRLLNESQDIRRWLPWILLPLIDPNAEGGIGGSRLQSGLCEEVIKLLRDGNSVPTTAGLAHPEEVHFFPERPDALLVLEDHLRRSQREGTRDLNLLAPENRETYQHLYRERGERFALAAQRIGLGQVSLMSFVNALSAQFGASTPKSGMSAKANHARSFFLNLCTLLEGVEPGVAREAALVLGESRIPLLPALDANGKEGAHLNMVRAESRQRNASARFQKATRVVFWQRSGDARVEIPTPPATVPIHFIAPSVIEHKPASIEWALSKFGEEWMVAAFSGRPDLFRRVAERAVDLKGERVLSVLGYLAGLLYEIATQSPTGGEDLRPRPYGAIDISMLQQALQVYGASKDRRSTARERLRRSQEWEHIWVPAQSEARWAHASLAVFGPGWCDILKSFLSSVEDKERGEELAPYERWGEAIERLSTFRESAGRPPEHPTYPAIAPPDHRRWETVLERLEQVIGDSDRTLQLKALFDLLLLFGVRIGPRVDWRWVDNGQQARPFETDHRSIDLKMSERIYQGRKVAEAVMPTELTGSTLMATYCKTLTLKPYHTAFSGGHSKGNRNYLRRHGNNQVSQLAAWIWLPDLVSTDAGELAFGDHLASVDAFRELLLPLWPDLSAQVLKTGWYSEKWGQHGRSWEKPIPSLAAFQLTRCKLWKARPIGHVDRVSQRRFAASVMVAWERDEAPSGRDHVRFFPLFDAWHDALSPVAQDLGILPLNNMTLTGALLRLHWLLQESCDTTDEPVDLEADCWPIKAPGDINRNDWLGVQYHLVERIVHAEPENLWDRRTVTTYGLTLRAAQLGGQIEIAVPVVTGKGDKAHFATGVALFKNPPRRWDRRESAGRWVLQVRSQLRRPLQKWAERLGAEILETVDPPAFTGELVTTSGAKEAIDALRQQVEDRLDLVLGILKASRVENLDQKAQQLLEAMGNLRAVNPTGTLSDGLSGLDEEGRLTFSYAAYRREQDERRTGAVVLAEGLALLLEQHTAVGDLQHALTAPRKQVELALDFRGVDVEALLGEVTSLAEKHLARLLGRIQQLLHALSGAKAEPAPQPAWQTKGVLANERLKAVRDLKEVRGKLAEQAQQAISKVAPGLSGSFRASLLRTGLDENLSPLNRARSFLGDLREAGWAIDKRQMFIEAYFERPLQIEQERTIEETMNRAVLVALIDQIRNGHLDDTAEPLQELDDRARKLHSRLTIQATDGGVDLVRQMKKILQISATVEPRAGDRLLLIEWKQETWQQLAHDLLEMGNEFLQEMDDRSLPRIHEDLQVALEKCLKEGSLAPLREGRERVWGERKRRIRRLEHGIARGTLSFNSVALRPSGPQTNTVTPETSTPGTGGGPGPAVTSDQAVRGRVAELFVLQVCWMQFVEADKDMRGQVLTDIASRRSKGSSHDDDQVRWSTVTAWRDLEKRLERHRDDLITCPEETDQVSGDVEKLFKALIEVANERGPGYDVLDPLGVWGRTQDDDLPHPDPRRVEIKAVLQDTEGQTVHRVVLTTNEYHRACRDPESYVLRLISVPRVPERHLD